MGLKDRLSHGSSVCYLLLQIRQVKCICREMRSENQEMKTVFQTHGRSHTFLTTVILGDDKVFLAGVFVRNSPEGHSSPGAPARPTHVATLHCAVNCVGESLSSPTMVSSVTARTESVRPPFIPGV